mgnify:CR=1 FL=1
MFGTNIARNSLSLTKVLSGISKGLGIVNQAIPIYKEIKPMMSNAKKVLEIAKEFNKSSNTKTIDVTPKKEVTKTVTPSVLTNSSPNPVFFQ